MTRLAVALVAVGVVVMLMVPPTYANHVDSMRPTANYPVPAHLPPSFVRPIIRR